MLPALIFVNGLGVSPAGWSAPRWEALRPLLPGFPEANVGEVCWENLFLGKVNTFSVQDLRAAVRELEGYFNDPALRRQAQNRVLEKVLPPLAAKQPVVCLAHSFGVPVVWEALRRLDASRPLLLTLLTPGAALAKPFVQERLEPRNFPAPVPTVRRWVNYATRYDWVGASLLPAGFPVSAEHLDLPATGCTRVLGRKLCAHMAYFDPANAVVQGLFAEEVLGAGT
jgi:hypothetical protein